MIAIDARKWREGLRKAREELMTDTVQVKGLKELGDALAGLEGKVGKKLVRQALRKGSKPIQMAAKAAAPKLSGALVKSIRIRSGGSKGNRITSKIVTSDKDNLFKGDQFYGAFQEFGWNKVPAFIGKGGGFVSKKRGSTPIRKMEGKHFMKAAAEAAGPSAIAIFAEDLGKTVPAAVAAHKKPQ